MNKTLLKKIRTTVATVTLLSLSLNLYSSEVDSHTNRTYNLDRLYDSSPAVDKIINYYLDIGIKKTNLKDDRSCSKKFVKKRKKLIKYTRKFLGGHFRVQNGPSNWGEANAYRVLKYPENYPELLKSMGIQLVLDDVSAEMVELIGLYSPLMITYNRVPESIYRTIPKTAAPSLGLVSLFHDTTGSIMKIGSGDDAFLMGSDKITHFFNRGRKYYAYFYGQKDDAKKIDSQAQRERFALDSSKYSELSLFGSKSTGVSSFGDLAANFQGIRFWNDFTARGKDIVTNKVNQPFVKCVDNKWVRTSRKFKLTDYANAAWDEANNCSYYKNQLIVNEIVANINQLPERADRKHCSVDMLQMLKLGETYGRFFNRTVNFEPYLLTPQNGNGFIITALTGDSGAPAAEHYKEKTTGEIYECEKVIRVKGREYPIYSDGWTMVQAKTNTSKLCNTIKEQLLERDELSMESQIIERENNCYELTKCSLKFKYDN